MIGMLYFVGSELLILSFLAYITRYTKLAGWLMLLGLGFTCGGFILA